MAQVHRSVQVQRFFDGAQTELGLIPLGTPPETALPVLEQTAWRFYSDNAAPATSTALGTENTQFPVDIVIESDKQYQLRVQLQNDGASSVAAPWLAIQRRFNGDAWQPLDGLATGAEVGTSVHFASGDSLSTSRLASPGGSYIAGSAIEAIPPYQTAPTITAGNYSEYVWCVKIIWAEVLSGDVIEFRLLRGTSATNVLPDYMTFTRVPSIVMFQSGVLATISDTWNLGWNAQSVATITRVSWTVDAWQFFSVNAHPDVESPLPLAPLNTQFVTIDSTQNFMLRFQVRNTDTRPDSSTIGIQYSTDMITWIGLTTNAANAFHIAATGSWISNATLNSPKLPVVVGGVYELGTAVQNLTVLTQSILVGGYTEYLWSIRADFFYISAPNTYYFRIGRGLISSSLGGEDIAYPTGIPNIALKIWYPYPLSVTATSTGPSTVTVSWTGSPAATGYDITRDDVVIATDHPGSPYYDTGLTPGTLYNYRVIAVF